MIAKTPHHLLRLPLYSVGVLLALGLVLLGAVGSALAAGAFALSTATAPFWRELSKRRVLRASSASPLVPQAESPSPSR